MVRVHAEVTIEDARAFSTELESHLVVSLEQVLAEYEVLDDQTVDGARTVTFTWNDNTVESRYPLDGLALRPVSVSLVSPEQQVGLQVSAEGKIAYMTVMSDGDLGLLVTQSESRLKAFELQAGSIHGRALEWDARGEITRDVVIQDPIKIAVTGGGWVDPDWIPAED
jgi:hypothetical protein